MDIRKLQRAIVDGLEDVKATDVVVFNTEHLSPLFERVVVASGNSNRQTKALASSVREAVKSAGGEILSVEGEDNGEWIIVDCGAAVAHIMQPAIRQYYHLEEIWGGKAVRMKLATVQRGLVKASEEDDEDEEPIAPRTRAAGKTPAPTSKPRTSSRGASAREALDELKARQAPKPKAKPRFTSGTASANAGSAAAPARKTGVPARKTSGSGTARTAQPRAAQSRGAAAAPAAPQGSACCSQDLTGPQAPGMKLWLVAVGQRQPDWAQVAYDDYAKRFPPELRLVLKAVKAEPRTLGKPIDALMAAEASRLEAAVPKNARRVVLDERGTRVTTLALADRLTAWQAEGRDVALLVGGPDGLDPALRATGDEALRLSDLTLPHATVRVLLAEALYRAWSVTVGHPYHRE